MSPLISWNIFLQLPFNYLFECLIWDSNLVHSPGNPLLLKLSFLRLCAVLVIINFFALGVAHWELDHCTIFPFLVIFLQLKYFHISVGVYIKIEVSFLLTRQRLHLSSAICVQYGPHLPHTLFSSYYKWLALPHMDFNVWIYAHAFISIVAEYSHFNNAMATYLS